MTQLKEVIHFYLRCPVWITRNIEGNPVIEQLTPHMLYDDYDELCEPSGERMRLMLRPLSSMTEEEMKHIWKLIHRRDFVGNNIIWFDKESSSSAKRWVLSSGCERLGIEMTGNIWADSDLHHFKYNPHFATAYLLSRGFDLFGLIESNQAIDTTHNPH